MTEASPLVEAIERLIERGGLPAPSFYTIDPGQTPTVHLPTPEAVRVWARYLRTYTARQIHVAGRGGARTYILVHIDGVLVRVQAPGQRTPPRGH